MINRIHYRFILTIKEIPDRLTVVSDELVVERDDIHCITITI